MATQGYLYISALRTQPRRLVPMPHAVEIKDRDYTEVQRWVTSKDAEGRYRYDDGFNRRIYYFSNPNTALEFRMRFT